MITKESFLRPGVLFWSFFVLAMFTLPIPTFLCDLTVRFLPFGLIEIGSNFLHTGTALPSGCRDTITSADLTIHLILLSILVAHLLMILVINFAPRREEAPHLLSSKEYLWMVTKTLFWCAVISAGCGAFASWAFQTPEIAKWMYENTNLHSPGQTIITLAIVISVSTIVLVAWCEDRFALWDMAFFAAETIMLIYEVTFILTGIDIIIVLLSLPFPSFNENFNPVFPPMWKEWYKDFQ